jgi:hypothetical protein
MSGTVHPYYSIALAPGIAALVAIGFRVLWGMRDKIAARAGLAAMVLATGLWDFVLLGRVSWAPGLRWIILVTAVAIAAALLVPIARLGRAGLIVALAAALPLGLGTAAWGVATAGTAHTGATPVSGPSGVSTGGFGGPGGGFGGGRGGFPGGGNGAGGGFAGGGFGGTGNTGTANGGTGAANGGTGTGGTGGTGTGGTGTGGTGTGGTGTGTGGNGNGGTNGTGTGNGSSTNANGNGAGAAGSGTAGDRTGGFGGPGGGGQADSALASLLKSAGTMRWAAATNGSMEAAPLQLASGKSVMAIGGFTGSDPSPTLAQFQKYVTDGDIHYYVSGGGGGGFGGRGGGGSQIEQWVTANFTATTVGSSTVYDLTKPTS